uniref:Putative histone tail methylase n=1 Tax=Nyssomyia neivai TaxID=330878 RepID=A0A1L8DX66_9DIPT
MPQNQQGHKKKKHHKHHHQDKNNNNASTSGDSGTEISSIGSWESSSDSDKRNNNTNLPYSIGFSPIMGRYLVAGRDLKPGDIIIQDNTLTIGPSVDGGMVCLGCYIPLSIQTPKCLGCGWPMCSTKCPGYREKFGHGGTECSILREKRLADTLEKFQGMSEMKQIYECILPLRCLLLRDSDPKRWAILMDMESHNAVRRKLPILWNRNQDVIVNRIRNSWGLKQFSEDEIHTVCGIIEVNCFEVGHNESRARALYPSAFLLAHDCRPNTTHTDHPVTHELHIRATTPIPKGETITLTYAYTLQGTLKRREHLQEGKFFWCCCQRCTDPTEFGTYSSALSCPKCTKGAIIATEPLNQAADWKCRDCGYSVSAKAMNILVDRIFEELEATDVNSIENLEEFLEKYRNVLHPNHYLSISAKYSLCQLYGKFEGYLIRDLSAKDLKRKETYCRDVLRVVDHLEPGMSRLRGVIMYELHAPIMIQATRQYESKDINGEELRKRLMEVYHLLKDSEAILAIEPEGSQEQTMAWAAKFALQRLKKSLMKIK